MLPVLVHALVLTVIFSQRPAQGSAESVDDDVELIGKTESDQETNEEYVKSVPDAKEGL